MDWLGGIIKRACGAGGSIKPRVKRSGTLGNVIEFCKARGTGDGRLICARVLPPAPRAQEILLSSFPGFRFAPPWALCFRLLRRLVEAKSLITAIVIVSLLTSSVAAQKKYERPAVKT